MKESAQPFVLCLCEPDKLSQGEHEVDALLCAASLGTSPGAGVVATLTQFKASCTQLPALRTAVRASRFKGSRSRAARRQGSPPGGPPLWPFMHRKHTLADQSSRGMLFVLGLLVPVFCFVIITSQHRPTMKQRLLEGINLGGHRRYVKKASLLHITANLDGLC